MTKILNFGFKIKGVVGRVAIVMSSDSATPPKFETCTNTSSHLTSATCIALPVKQESMVQ